MATYVQRGQNIGNALINAVATAAQLDRLGTALAWNNQQLDEYLAGDNNLKAQIFVSSFRQFCLDTIRNYEATKAMQEAAVAAAAAANSAFPETP